MWPNVLFSCSKVNPNDRIGLNTKKGWKPFDFQPIAWQCPRKVYNRDFKRNQEILKAKKISHLLGVYFLLISIKRL